MGRRGGRRAEGAGGTGGPEGQREGGGVHAFDEKEPLALCGLADDLTSGSQPDPAHLRQQVGGQARGERGRQRAERGAA